jgi:hypothetical protein
VLFRSGCNVNDIPGNRPEDVEQDVLMTEFYESLSADEVNVITGLEEFTTKIKLEGIIWKAIEFGRRVNNQQDQPEDYQEEESKKIEGASSGLDLEPSCCCCTSYDTEGNIVKAPEARLLFKCERPGCSCYTCGEHRQTCGYCLGCCVEVHEAFNHSIKEEGELSAS